jgi:iron complex transport system ATP-binding protein
MTKPYLILLDEPCAGMDPGARESFLASLGWLGAQKKVPALIYVTHHIEEILPLFGKLLVLCSGRVLDSGNTRDVLKPRVLRKLYGAPLSLQRRKGRYWPVI